MRCSAALRPPRALRRATTCVRTYSASRGIGNGRRKPARAVGLPSGDPADTAGGTTGDTTVAVTTPTPTRRQPPPTEPQGRRQGGQVPSTTSTSNQAGMLGNRVRGGIRTQARSPGRPGITSPILILVLFGVQAPRLADGHASGEPPIRTGSRTRSVFKNECGRTIVSLHWSGP